MSPRFSFKPLMLAEFSFYAFSRQRQKAFFFLQPFYVELHPYLPEFLFWIGIRACLFFSFVRAETSFSLLSIILPNIRAAKVDKFCFSANGPMQLDMYSYFWAILTHSMKLKSISALVSISAIIVGGVLQGLNFSSGKAIVFLGVGILIFIYIPIFLIGLSRDK